MSFVNDIRGKRVLVFGLGLQGGGVGDAIWLSQHGATVRVTDLKSEAELRSSLIKLPQGVTHTLGSHLDSDIEWADLIIKNPGVPDSQPQISHAKQLGKPVYTSIALVVKEGRDKIIGITGTRGKTTTTELTYSLLDSLYKGKVQKGGNLSGTSALTLLDQLDTLDYLVLELSSFQLAGLHDLRVSPHYAILTNIYPDHLNRYLSMTEYMADKSAIFAYQKEGDHFFTNGDNQLALKLASSAPNQPVLFYASDTPDWSLKLKGGHNRENLAALIVLAKTLKIKLESVKKVAESFSPVEYRLEHIRTLDGVEYYNDTTSTTPTATIKALSAFDKPLTLIIGGDDKQLPADELIKSLKDSPNLSHLILLGGQNIPTISNQIKQLPQFHSQVFSMSEAVSLAHSLAAEDEVVLLSPAFASFDLFENEFDRGRQFNEAVKKLQ